MSHFAVIAPPFFSHVRALQHLSQALIARGHRVTFIQQIDVKALLSDSDIGFFPLGLASHPAGSLAHTLQLAAHPLGPSMLKLINEMARTSDMLCRELPVVLNTLAVDGVIVDQMEPAGALAAEALDLPYVSVACALPLNREADFPLAVMPFDYGTSDAALERYRTSEKIYDWLMRRHDRVIARNAHALGLAPREKLHHCFSPLAQISQLIPAFDFPRQALPDHFHAVGPLRAIQPSSSSAPHYFPHGDKPRIFASLGTLQGHRYALFKTIVRACQELDAQLLLAHCGRLTPFQAAKLARASQTQVVDFTDQAAALAQADLAITHGGMNTVLDAINHLTPLLAIPLAFDQPGVAARIVYHGVGRRASRFTTSHALARQLQTLLADDRYRQQMLRMRNAVAEAGGSALAAAIVEQAVLTRRPVVSRRDYAVV
ncbi:zeaxanthin glucosyltransferase [Pantoea sp. AN62]|uniref:glycosyltransferase n=1 Tax=Pantoea TaxID=53335 RepID=UPI000A25E97A|nr:MULTISPECIES: glycosyltransferase [Pantoea]MCQ5472004.1 glycosyltransferase [Pantoea brenneri]MDU4747489.1 glycosyltransferase [Pantoea sp.]ORM57992.1 zeaxanthin glucosyltransferase [Pantoea brenneri]OXM20242.1 zeaxanthin glucosyltransferase [Pantoea sp. AV62]